VPIEAGKRDGLACTKPCRAAEAREFFYFHRNQACYELWRSRGAEFITEPKDKYGETRCYIRDPDGYITEVGQSKPDFTYG
jgi:hypothetical protein